jgi:hypothetical protein
MAALSGQMRAKRIIGSMRPPFTAPVLSGAGIHAARAPEVAEALLTGLNFE